MYIAPYVLEVLQGRCIMIMIIMIIIIIFLKVPGNEVGLPETKYKFVYHNYSCKTAIVHIVYVISPIVS